MKKFNKKQIAVLKECSAGFISSDEALKSLNIQITYQSLIEILSNLAKIGDKKTFSTVFDSLSGVLSFEEENMLYQKFITEDIHFLHEQIISAFQTYFNNDPENIKYLLLALEYIPKYLSNNDMKYPYIRKLIYAIGAQPEPHNIDALTKLSEDAEDEEIRKLALHQIKKRKKLGRWEAKQNT